nr:ethanolamine ammonia-lyase reactivating factor EutA [Pseudonocardia acidicola]
MWRLENVELTTVGIDIGSSTSHLMFARVHLQRQAQALSSRFVVVDREVLWRSPVLLTPYLADYTIDADVLDEFVRRCYRQAGLERSAVDSGAVVLTGEALKRRNARAIADLFAAESGKFVCASAGHHLEAVMAAHGSGAVAASREEPGVRLHVDIGGGTSKLAVLAGGDVLGTAAVAVGGRLVALDGRRVVRVEGPAMQMAQAAGVPLRLGDQLSRTDEARLVEAFVEVLLGCIHGNTPPSGYPANLLLVDDRPLHPRPTSISFSGGVAEYLDEEGSVPGFGDLARPLAEAIRRALGDGRLDLTRRVVRHRIRATVIGASQFSVQVSGNTSGLSGPTVLPLRNLPVLYPRLDLSGAVSADETAAAIAAAARRFDVTGAEDPVAVAFRWQGDPAYPRLRALAEGIVAGLRPHLNSGHPLVVLLDRDVAQSLGHLLTRELGIQSPLVCLDGLTLQEFDYVDIGDPIQPANVVPLVIKSLLFAGPTSPRSDTGLLSEGVAS